MNDNKNRLRDLMGPSQPGDPYPNAPTDGSFVGGDTLKLTLDPRSYSSFEDDGDYLAAMGLPLPPAGASPRPEHAMEDGDDSSLTRQDIKANASAFRAAQLAVAEKQTLALCAYV